ncbi:MAG: MerC domain-containing protein [Bacteroidota bacterium]
MSLDSTINKSDNIGAFASSLCLVHCIATPFIFVSSSCAISCGANSPFWWVAIDYLFIAISFFAVYWSAKNTSKEWMRYAFWISWALLLVVIANERLSLVPLTGYAIYIPAIGLVGLHLYNKKYCQCVDTGFCSTT